jgi:hypothetical protein
MIEGGLLNVLYRLSRTPRHVCVRVIVGNTDVRIDRDRTPVIVLSPIYKHTESPIEGIDLQTNSQNLEKPHSLKPFLCFHPNLYS